MKRLLFALLLISVAEAAVTQPALPQISVDPNTHPSPGALTPVHNGDNLQAKYNAASCGDTLVLDAGATFAPLLANKVCNSSNWLSIVSANLSAIPVTNYVSCQMNRNPSTACPAPNAANFPTITSGTTGALLRNSDGTCGNYNYFAGIRITTTATTEYMLVDVSNNFGETLASQLCQHITYDRMYLTMPASSTTIQAQHGFSVAGNYIAIVNSYIENLYGSGFESQAIILFQGDGFLIHNNFLEGAAENIMEGGVGATIHYSCTVAASPAPTTTTATVNTCIDQASMTVATPPIGSYVMWISNGTYNPYYWTQITANTAGALTFTRADGQGAIPSPPDSGANKVRWGLTGDDVTVTNNVMYKPLSWNSSDPSWDRINRCTKNLFEIKTGRRWLVEGNWEENGFGNCQGQAGVGAVFKATDPSGNCAWCWASDITYRNNVAKNIGNAITISPCEAYFGPANGCLQRVLISNNLFWPANIGRVIPSFAGIISLPPAVPGEYAILDSLQIIHNNLIGPGIFLAKGDPTDITNYTNLLMRDNIVELSQYRLPGQNACSGGIDGTACFTQLVSSSYVADHNAAINSSTITDQPITDTQTVTRYGSVIASIVDTNIGAGYAGVGFTNYSAVSSDYTNWKLTNASGLHGLASDGTDPGVNLAALTAALQGAVGGPPPSSISCDLNNDGTVNVLDVQLATNQALGYATCGSAALTGSGQCTVVDVQRIISASLGASCYLGP